MIPFLAKYNNIDRALRESDIVAGIADAESCKIVRKISGEYTLELTCPLNGPIAEELNTQDCYIYAQGPTKQFYKVTRIKKDLRSLTLYAVHPTYFLGGIAVPPGTSSGTPSTVINAIWNRSQGAKSIFYLTSTMSTSPGTSTISEFTSAREALQGVRGSIVDTFGGFIDYGYGVNGTGNPAYTATHKAFPSDTPIEIYYGVNLTDLRSEEDSESYFRGVRPYWTGDNTRTWGSAVYFSDAKNYGGVKWLDLSQDFQTQPTIAQMTTAAQNYLDAHKPNEVTISLNTNFYKTTEYAMRTGGTTEPITFYQSDIRIGGPANITIPNRGYRLASKISGFEYNLLTERYTNITIDNIRKSLGALLAQLSKKGGVAL